MSIKQESVPPEKPKTDGKTNYKTTILNTLPSVINVPHGNEQASPLTPNERKIRAECAQLYKEKIKVMQENAMSIFRAKCESCSYSNYGRALDDCIHTKCPLWKYRNCELVEYIGIEEGCAGFVATTNLNKTRGDGT